MPLSADQQATLQLVLGRDQSYADLSELLGTSEAEVRERARSALEELAGTNPDRTVALTDYLLGQADPIARADVVRHLREDPADHRLATDLVAKLRELVPEAGFPRLPGEPRTGRFLRRDPVSTERAETGAGSGEGAGIAARLSPGQSRLLVALAAGAVLLIAVVLGITGAFGGGDDGEAAPVAEETVDEEVSRVALTPPGDGDAGGEAIFGLTGADTIYLDLDLARLDPPDEGETYVVWLLLTGQQGWPLSPVPVGPNGAFQERLAVPAGLVPLVARVRFLEVTLASDERLERMFEQATEQAADAEDLDSFLIEVVGETALRGAVPVEEGPAADDEALEGLEDPGDDGP